MVSESQSPSLHGIRGKLIEKHQAPKRYLTDKDITAERIRAQRRLALSPCEDCEFSGYSCWVGDNSGKCAPCAEQGGTIAQCGVLVDHYRVIPRRVSKKNAESPPSTKMSVSHQKKHRYGLTESQGWSPP